MRSGRLLSVAGAVLSVVMAMTLFVSEAGACDACNKAFQRELENDRADTLLGQEFAQTYENHAQFDVLTDAFRAGDEATTEEVSNTGAAVDGQQPAATDSNLDLEQARAEAMALDESNNQPEIAGAGGDIGPMAMAGQQRAGADAPVQPNPNERDFDEIYEDDQFIEIIERDQGLENTPPTSYVPQETEPDEEVTIELGEGKTYLGQGVMYDGFLTDGTVPGPTFHVEQGDIVKFNIKNTGTVPHGGSIHAAYTQTSKYVGEIPPGETKSVTFRATYPGVFMYHCAPGGHAIPMHVMAGQYGMMVVEPEQNYQLEEELGHGPDLTMYILQNEFYTSGKDAVESNPAYAAFNGQPFRYIEDPIGVEPGDYVRIYYMNAGPNLLSTFHFVGIIWDYVYWQGHPEAMMPGGQTVTAGPSDTWVIEFRVPPDEGVYTMLTHAVGYATRGAIGLLAAEEGADGPDVVDAQGPEFSDEEIQDKADEVNRTIAPFSPSSEDLEYPEQYGEDVDEVVVDIKGNSYDPAVIEIEPGTKVTFRNKEVFGYMAGEFSGLHNAVATDGPEEFSTRMLAHYEKDSVVLEEPGEYTYICSPHPYMEGKIIVREADDDETGIGCSVAGGPAAPVAVVALMLLGLAAVRRARESEAV